MARRQEAASTGHPLGPAPTVGAWPVAATQRRLVILMHSEEVLDPANLVVDRPAAPAEADHLVANCLSCEPTKVMHSCCPVETSQSAYCSAKIAHFAGRIPV